ncbi:oligosaccharyl transferase, archaeosortase A system-associated [Methanolobus bombayensis]|uniref:oligosaccharyl transferase, archaeosortase A system-associated n=1 Tax=Methanolobus bombayensis TaxID=38023 RepID=UPI001AE6DF00|nr:oligosaccharyl transferase, archaeosortase A system-associated [Methanolobus bombayensis]MBP1908185.1 dolichyl-diphosphooligosaccharide--protein glycosyltransferase [Methanolobus bombayensis]
MEDEKKKSFDIKNGLPYLIGVVISFLIAFYIRTVPKAGVFISDTFVRFGGNDPWYHFRNVESIIHNFPHMLWFDAYTQFPNGTDQVFAPLFDLVLATIIWVLGVGNPDQNLIYTISAYYPSILGALVVIPTYFVGKWLFNKRTGLLASFLIAISCGQFLSRSIIGFNDHHIAETLLSTVVAMFLIMAIKKADQNKITFSDLKEMNLNPIKPAIPYLILTGIALGAYSLAWKGALFFSFIIGVYITVQHIINHMHGKSTDYLAISGMIIFFIALIMVLMTPYLGGTKSLYIKGLLAGIIAFPILTGISIVSKHKGLKNYYFPVSIATLFIIGVLAAKLFSESAYSLITSVFSYFMRTGGGLTVAEASPLLSIGGQFSLQPLWYNFGALGYISFIALAILIYKAFTQKNTPDKIFLLVWTLMIIWAMLQQNRFAYYYSVNAAILSAWIGIEILNFAGWQSLIDSIKSKTFNAKNIKAMHILSAIFILLIMVYPSYSLATQQNQGTGGPNGYWIEATQWLRYNTPDPGLDYYENYEIPADGESYQYPETAYGVMSWWDYGHWIEVIGHRIPNANPFQQGIGGRRNSIEQENRPGASTFFTAPSEEEATEVLEAVHPDPDKAGARYIVSDVEMATGKFYAMTAWTLDTADYYVQVQTDSGYMNVPGQRYFNSMEARLHMFDGNGLKQYRMVHESPIGNSQETGYKNVYNVLFGGNLEEENSGYVKIFEYVEGATITGTAPANETVTISNTILTSQMRTFTYTQTTTSDGTYSFTVPYSTTGPIEGETQFDTMPTGPYVISYGDTTQQVSVSETDVLNGNVIEI